MADAAAGGWREPNETEVAAIVRGARVVAVVGMKGASSPMAPAFTVPQRMKSAGIRVVPINPREVLGERTLASVAELTEGPDVVVVFRRAEFVPALADEIVALPASLRPKVVWLQSGIVSEPAAETLEANGVRVVMDRCFAVDLVRLGR